MSGRTFRCVVTAAFIFNSGLSQQGLERRTAELVHAMDTDA